MNTIYDIMMSFEGPTYHLVLEGVLLIWVLWLLFKKSYKPEVTELSEKEKDELIKEWDPEPLVPEVPQDHYALNPRVITSKLGKFIVVDGKECLNLGTHNYLGLLESKLVEENAIKSLRKYGVGSCGPRGFYGTVDIHLDLEGRLAKFMNVEEAVLYSYGFSTVASAIPAYSKRGDIIYADESVHLAIQKGLLGSRSKIHFFKHNDVEDLERLLLEQADKDEKNPKKAKVTRKFLVVEGLYMNRGTICRLPEILSLAKKFKVRLFIDETVSFGVLGKTGRGVTEHYNIPTSEIDHFSASLENAISSFGGFCCGTSFIVDHQRLSGLGYCFSASLPPLQAAAAIAALDVLENKDCNLVEILQKNALEMHKRLEKCSNIDVEGADISPVKHIRFSSRGKPEYETRRLEKVVQDAWNESYALTVARYIEKEENNCPEPSIRLTVNAALSIDEIQKAAKTLESLFIKFEEQDI